MTIISLTLSESFDHLLWMKDRGNTKAALPTIMRSSKTQKSQITSRGLEFCVTKIVCRKQSSQSCMLLLTSHSK